MVIHRASDSLSRYDPNLYSTIYDVRKRSNIEHEPISPTRTSHKDTIEISRDKLKKEALNRLRHTSKYVIAQNGFMRVGKYLFLTVAFPPYFLLYGLPKWVLVVALPALFSMPVWMWKKVKQKSEKQIEAAARKVTQAIHFMQQLRRRLIHPVVHLTLEIRQSLHRMRQRVNQFFQHIKEKTRGKAGGVVHRSQQRVKEIAKHLKRNLIEAKKWSFNQTQTVAIRLQEGIQWIKESPQFILGWGQLQFQQWSERSVFLGQPLLNQLKNSQQLAERATHWIFNQFKAGKNCVKRQFQPFTTFYREQFQPRWQQLKAVCKQKYKQIKDFCQQQHQKTLTFLQQKQERIKKLTYQHLIDYCLSHSLVHRLPKGFQDWLKNCFSHPFVRSFCQGLVKGYSLIARFFLRAMSRLMQGISSSCQFVAKACHRLKVYAKKGMTKSLHALQMGRVSCHKLLKQSIYYFLLFLMIVGILSMWGVHALKESMILLTDKFFPFKAK